MCSLKLLRMSRSLDTPLFQPKNSGFAVEVFVPLETCPNAFVPVIRMITRIVK